MFCLRESRDPWRSHSFAGEEVDDALVALTNKTRAILNKLAAQKFDHLVGMFNQLEIDTEEELSICVQTVLHAVGLHQQVCP
jgi:hypothetical protein